MAIYAAGIVLNDLFDLEIDRAERPGRPLPSGRVSLRFAALLGFGLLVAGLVLALASGSTASVGVALGLAACVVGYDAGLKRTWFGPLVMGACRGLNVLLGMSQAPDLGGPIGWLVAGSMALFVVGITWISRSETRAGDVAGPGAGWVLQNLGLLGLVGAGTLADRFPPGSTLAETSPGARLSGMLVLLLVAVVVNRATGRAVFDSVPTRLQQAVKTGVLSLVWLNVGVVAAVRGPLAALAVALLWLPAFVLGKWLYST
jgi:4-hydroxybenzoate polyprenyltransferase